MLKNLTFFASAASLSALALAGCGDADDTTSMAELEVAEEMTDDSVVGAPGAATDTPEIGPAQAVGDPTMTTPAVNDTDAGQSMDMPAGGDYGEPAARADFEFAGMGESGTAWFFETDEGVAVQVRVRGMEPGGHAIHVHTTGDCSASDFTSAGPHLGEDAGEMLDDRPADFEAGVLPDITVEDDGSGMLDAVLEVVVFENAGDGEWPLFDADGAAIVIHEMSTDEAAGGDNARIACAELYESDM